MCDDFSLSSKDFSYEKVQHSVEGPRQSFNIVHNDAFDVTFAEFANSEGYQFMTWRACGSDDSVQRFHRHVLRRDFFLKFFKATIAEQEQEKEGKLFEDCDWHSARGSASLGSFTGDKRSGSRGG